ncbi:PSD1 and planctomycete cytochrome C domain-containing protein [Novipirellula artificiosorum]|uniref:Planctomycete cytochrome C n=1 Tax=Novipirellula artificiosorum TaxID=2528016 RepID=A0A5C6DC05_9BACT|nr:PSD1 and planctomycete cytochrome C domain-containing protein [Novipirellula artificiosorum]TWU34238.1 Planctomycete cytochrome C [Novipirellula artificiosorum]
MKYVDSRCRFLTFSFVFVFLGFARADESIDFNRDIRPILFSKCVSCHGPDEGSREAGLRLDTESGAVQDLGGYAAVVPGNPGASELVLRIASDDEDMRMPPTDKGKPLSDDEIDLFQNWIQQGGAYAKHWSYKKPIRPAQPSIEGDQWVCNPIDAFVLAKLEAQGMSPAPEADRLTLARRLSIDLTGLPPTWEEAKAFADDPSDQAYEAYVDSLLAKPSYGERWARVWLDLARYADSAGYADDPPREIWAFRDYVIDSLNQNKPFDQFTIEQIAGDLLAEPTEEQLIATAFHRNTMTNSEGGTNDEEFRNAAIIDRVNTTMAVWMGTTMACAQCHTHKYDPISHTEYFQFFAFFNHTADHDQKDERPVLELWSDEQTAARTALQHEIEAVKAQSNAPHPELLALQQELEKTKPRATVPIMQELPTNKRRTSTIQIRGNYLSKGEEVHESTPQAFHPLSDPTSPDRLDLAKWLVDPENPLTARVIANRHWEQLFGIGIVESSEEFGSQGELPSHPQLLDWMAVELQENGWDLKSLLKTIVMSATYRQTSATNEILQQADPRNRLLARGPRFRVSAEMVRDQALFASGLLSDIMGGPPANPPQPELGLKAAFGGKTDWTTSAGPNRYRRGIYTSWRRSSPYPSMAQFDAPNREVCTIRRIRTNTPLQALVTLNDPVYVEAAQALARRMITAGETEREKIQFAFRVCLTRNPTNQEIDRIKTLYTDAHKVFLKDAKAAAAMATDPIGEPIDGMDLAELAAWSVVGNVLLNLDELLMKR